jgi:hypothetical protein
MLQRRNEMFKTCVPNSRPHAMTFGSTGVNRNSESGISLVNVAFDDRYRETA